MDGVKKLFEAIITVSEKHLAEEEDDVPPVAFVLMEGGTVLPIPLTSASDSTERRESLFLAGKTVKKLGANEPLAIVFGSQAYVIHRKELVDGERPSQAPDRTEVLIVVGLHRDGTEAQFFAPIQIENGMPRKVVRSGEHYAYSKFGDGPKIKTQDSLLNSFWEGYNK